MSVCKYYAEIECLEDHENATPDIYRCIVGVTSSGKMEDEEIQSFFKEHFMAEGVEMIEVKIVHFSRLH